MDFDDTPEEAALRAEAIAFLDAHAPDDPDARRAGGGTLVTDAAAEHRFVEASRAWQRTKAEHGWACLTWPTEYGGRGLDGLMDGIFREEESARVSYTGVFAVGIGMAGPTVIVHGTEAQKERFLPPMSRGEEIWCQLFSEPGAGSDLGGLRTSAVRDGDEFVVNGQKVWTSGAQYSEWGILLVRTDPDQPKHRGITYLLVDMTTPGIEVRPLVQITGAAHFNEVFLTDVRVPVDNVVGEVNAGWGPIMTTLSNERSLIGNSGGRSSVVEVVELARRLGVERDPVIRQQLARLHCEAEALRYLRYRVRTATSRGEAPGPESSVMKLAVSQHVHNMGNATMAIQGAAGMLASAAAVDDGRWQQEFLGQWGTRIGGGTDEIQRNTIGEKVLALPPEPRVDKGVAFRDIPQGST